MEGIENVGAPRMYKEYGLLGVLFC